MTLWIVEYVAGGPGCPPVLKGKLDRPGYGSWRCPHECSSPAGCRRPSGTTTCAGNRNLPDVPVLESVARFEIAESRVPETAAFICTDVGRSLVCTDEFKHACESAELRGMRFSPLSEYTKADFWD